MIGLGYLITLEHLNLNNNKIKIVEGIETLENLITLNLANNCITTALSLRGLSLNL